MQENKSKINKTGIKAKNQKDDTLKYNVGRKLTQRR